MKKIKVTESQIKRIVNTLTESELKEYGTPGLYKKQWTEDDQVIAFYIAKFGEEIFKRTTGFTLNDVATDVIGTSPDSLKHQIANFKSLMDGGKSGLNRPHYLQTDVFNQYSDYSVKDMKEIISNAVIDAMGDEDRLNKYKAGKEIGDKRDQIEKDREKLLKQKGWNYNPAKMKVTRSVPKDELDKEYEPSFTEPSSDTIDFLKSMINSIDNIKETNDLSKLDNIKDDLMFMIDYMKSELGTEKMVSEMKRRTKKYLK